MQVMKISDFINKRLATTSAKALALELNISQAMVYTYKKSFNASLPVALNIYKLHNIVIFPYGEYALKELAND